MAHLERRRADGFGAMAELYDRVRPSYPPELIAELVAGAPAATTPVHRILDVGSGTGKLARQLAGPDRQVLGVEPDTRMAAVAARHGITVDNAAFERWDDAGRRFNLLTAGQSWHWVDPTAGAVKAHTVLHPGARFAAMWNRMNHIPEVRAVAVAVYDRYAPNLATTSIVLEAREASPGRVDAARGLDAAGFVDIDIRAGDAYHREVDYTPEEWVELVSTHSDHAVLDATVRIPLLEGLRAGLDKLGPTVPVDLHTDVLLATRPEN